MAKKSVANATKKEGVRNTKCIKMERSPKTGAFVFTEEIVDSAEVKAFFAKK
jgi:hypothetical protein